MGKPADSYDSQTFEGELQNSTAHILTSIRTQVDRLKRGEHPSAARLLDELEQVVEDIERKISRL